MLGTLTAWAGWEVRRAVADEADARTDFARSAPAPAAGEARYELLAVAARGFRPPQFLSTHDLPPASATVAPEELDRSAEAGYEALRSTWSLLYRVVAESTPAAVVPYAVYLLGVNPPPGASREELEVFNDFYTNVHLPEVAERRRALRAVRYELVAELRAPHLGAPRYLALYELDEQAAAQRRHVGPPYRAGPEVWQRHTTPWRLWYRRLVGEEAAR